MMMKESPEINVARKRFEMFKEALDATGMSVGEFIKQYEPAMEESMEGEENEGSPEEEASESPEEEKQEMDSGMDSEDKEPGEGNEAKRKAIILLLKKKRAGI